MQGRELQTQRQRADIQVDQTAAFAVFDVGDESAGQCALIARCLHDQYSMTDRCSVAVGDGLPARQQGGGQGLHQA